MSLKAIVFAGQGAQAVGMGKDLAAAYPECKALFDKADDALGYKLSKICFEGPAEELTKTAHCQPAIFTASMACVTALSRRVPGIEGTFKGTAGLSLGEWTALHMAGAIGYEDALRVLAARGRFMQEACEERPGGMVSVIGLPVNKLREICAATGVEIANLNSAEQTVLSGPKEAIMAATKLAGELGAKKTVALNVAGAYHSSLMASAAKKLEAVLAGIQIMPPRIPVVANVTGLPHGEPDQIRIAMVKQVTSSVQWVSGVEWFTKNGFRQYLECGPGKVLSGLISRIDREAVIANIQDAQSLEKAVVASTAA